MYIQSFFTAVLACIIISLSGECGLLFPVSTSILKWITRMSLIYSLRVAFYRAKVLISIRPRSEIVSACFTFLCDLAFFFRGCTLATRPTTKSILMPAFTLKRNSAYFAGEFVVFYPKGQGAFKIAELAFISSAVVKYISTVFAYYGFFFAPHISSNKGASPITCAIAEVAPRDWACVLESKKRERYSDLSAVIIPRIECFTT
jgi:hypothetical protein